MRQMMHRLLLGGALLATSCGLDAVTQKAFDEMQEELTRQRNRIVVLEAQINDGLTLALCSPELRQLLEDVQRECIVSGAKGINQCSTKQIRGAVINADPEHRGRFLKLMSHLPHEVLYLAKNATEAVPYRIERLDRLTKPALLKSTVFLVVSSPEADEAEAMRRAEVVDHWLQQRGIPPHVVHRWIYAFPATRLDIVRQIDQPGMAETKELNRGVWVFRADC